MEWFNKENNQALPWSHIFEHLAKSEIEILRKFLEIV